MNKNEQWLGWIRVSTLAVCVAAFVTVAAAQSAPAAETPKADVPRDARGLTVKTEINAAEPDIVGVPVAIKEAPVVETVEQLMAREALTPPPMIARPTYTHPEFEYEGEWKDNPEAPAVSQWPPAQEQASGPIEPTSPQSVGVSFQGIFLNPPTFNESGNIPPDSMGDVGPTQVLVASNGRFKVFDKTGVLGALNVSDTTFWASVSNSVAASDPEVRYDRISGRWFVLAVNISSTNNRVMVAVSSGSTITSTSSFTYYFFAIGTPLPADASNFCDYPSLGVDANALYGGCNMFSSTGTFQHTSAYVIRKSSVTSGGPIVVTGFANITSGTTAGPYSPRGVDNDDPQATEGYIIGTDIALLSRIQIRRVSTPGGTPTLSGNITLTPPTTTNMSRQLSPTNTTQTNGIDVSDTRLFMASIHKNKLTGTSSLWTAHGVETDATCTALTSGSQQRIGARWYEIGSLTTTPTITQSGTLCTSGSSSTVNSLRGYIYPTVAETGQGHMALGATYASSVPGENPGVATSGRLRTDAAGSTQAATVVLAGTGTYRLCDGNGGACPRNRWGDYSFTDVDPNDDQTIWTFQEYALDATGSGFAGNWAVRAVQLKAPPPATPSSFSPSAVCTGLSSVSTTLSGTSSSGSEFFDPGPDTGGPGYTNHIGATITGGVVVNSASIVIPGSPSTTPVTQMTFSLNTTGASAGAKNVTVTNPDGQAATGTGILTVNSPAGAPTAGNNGPVCAGGTINLTASTIAGATYTWTGPNGFTSTQQNPSIANATAANAGTYSVTATTAGCAAGPAGTTNVTIIANGGACTDSNACTSGDTCQAGVCTGTPIICTPSDQCHVAGTCNPGTGLCSNPAAPNGTTCNDGNACTQSDTCQSGACTGSNPVVCTASDQCHVAGTCNPGTGLCSNPAVPDGTSCSDGNACTTGDTCQSGSCSPGTPTICTASDQCHVAGTCDTATGQCSNPAALNGTSCTDGNACTVGDSCQSGVCASGAPVICVASDQCHVAGTCDTVTGQCSNPAAPNGTSCTDGNACTVGDTCQSGTCAPGASTICTASDQCHVAGTCDTATGLCSDPAAPDGTSCSDGNACTTGDTCQSGSCAPGTETVCTASDQCHVAGTCDTTTGECSNPAAPNGTSCSDDNACTTGDSCQDGTCTPGVGTVCTASDQCHVAGTCDTATGHCSNPAAPNGTSCTDGNACTVGDSCQSGVCASGAPVICVASDQCHVAGTCDTVTGRCSNPAAPNGTSCTDGNACTVGDTCQSGTCAPGASTICTASDQCHVAGTCDTATGLCSDPAAPDGTSCSDGNACTTGDTCQSGSCAPGTETVCTASDQCHVAGTCDTATGECSNPAAPNGTSCSDDNACTTGDSCQDGTCTPGVGTVCTASDQCHVAGTCDTATGHCSNPAAPNGTSCTDGNACTVGDSCQSGVCASGAPVICVASDQCHVAGMCDPGSGFCSNPAAPDGTSCSDGNACTVGDTCQSGTCAPGASTICTASDQCHVAGTCDTATGLCSDPAAPDGTSCSDGNACTTGDTCQSGSCAPGTETVCTASDQCHVAGTCDTATGECSNPAASDGTSCTDANACTIGDTCQDGACTPGVGIVCAPSDQCHVAGTCDTATGHCSNPAAPNGTSCTDGNACTVGDSCQSGVCASGAPVICVASDQCHVAGTCDTVTGQCSNPAAPNGTSCTDGNACTVGDTCQSGTCAPGASTICTASDQCHVAGTCDTATGLCSNPAAPNGTSCTDGNACTVGDTCQSGACSSGAPVVCVASDQCHVAGTCDTITGFCSNPEAPDGTACSDGNACTLDDTCSGGVCQPGTPVAPPAETTNLRVQEDKQTYIWDPQPDSPRYDVVRGLLGALPVGPGGADESCFDDLVAAVITDGDLPLEGTGFWYLSRAENDCAGPGTYGTEGVNGAPGAPRITSTCP